MNVATTTPTVVELSEYQHRQLPAPAPTESDLHLAERLTRDETRSRLAVRWLATGDVDITASSWVGVVRFSRLDVHVVPKLVGGALPVLRMIDYAAGIDMLRNLPSRRPLPAGGGDLFDLICLLLTEETHALIRDGLLRDYRPTDDSLEVLRGRMRYRDQYLRRFGRLDKLECHFDEYDSDTPDNQLVATALTMACRRVHDPGIRFALTRFAGIMTEACQPVSSDATWYEANINYQRRNARYRPAHELSKLILRGLAFDDLYDTRAGDVTAFLLDMNRVFERFVTRLVHDALAGTSLRPTTQRRLRAVIRNDRTNRSYATITPDLVIEETLTDRSVPIDIKYKAYDTNKISTSDIYQTFLYAYALSKDASERRAGILFPATAVTATGPRLSIKPVNGPTAARIVGSGIDVPAALKALATGQHEGLFDDVRTAIRNTTGFDAGPQQAR